MTGVARIGDSVNTGHNCTTSTTIILANERVGTVFADNIAVAIANDTTDTHSYGGKNCSLTHKVILTVGSGTVFMDGQAILRIDDATSGEKITGGSSTVFAGD